MPDLDIPEAHVTRLRERWAAGRRHLLLLIGYVQVEKGHLEAVRAVAELLRRRPDLRDHVALVIAGEVRRRPAGFERFERADRDYEAQVRSLVTAEGLDDVVVWTGHVPEEDFDAWFRAADVVLLPYAAAEESGIAGHAIATDAPVLAARVGGLAALFGDTAMALESREPGPFAGALARVLDDPAAARRAAADVHADLRRRRSATALVDAVLPAGGAR